MEDKKRILIFSDVHHSIDSKKEETEWFSSMEKFLPGKIADFYLRYWDNLTQSCFQKMLEKASRLKPFGYLFDLGDSAPIWRQNGLSATEAIRYVQAIDDFLEGDSVQKKFLWGNHDLGFQSKTAKTVFCPKSPETNCIFLVEPGI